jgi:hypothetical protein
MARTGESLDGPAHARLFGALSDEGLAGCFDGSGADEPAVVPVVLVLHAVGVAGEVVERFAGFLAEFPLVVVELEGVDGGEDGVDVAVGEVVEQVVGVAVGVGQDVVEDFDEVVDVFAGVSVVDDVGGFGEESFGDVPDPFRAVADDDGLPDPVEPASVVFGFQVGRELAGGGEG